MNNIETIDKVKKLDPPLSFRKRSNANFKSSIEKIRSLTTNSFYKVPHPSNYEAESKESIFKIDIKKIRPSSINSVSSAF